MLRPSHENQASLYNMTQTSQQHAKKKQKQCRTPTQHNNVELQYNSNVATPSSQLVQHNTNQQHAKHNKLLGVWSLIGNQKMAISTTRLCYSHTTYIVGIPRAKFLL